jgi:hypothetical protein
MQASRIVAVHPSIPFFRNSHLAFEEAIRVGRLSSDSRSPLFAGNFTYMGTWEGIDAFKHVHTGEYLPRRVGSQNGEVCL